MHALGVCERVYSEPFSAKNQHCLNEIGRRGVACGAVCIPTIVIVKCVHHLQVHVLIYLVLKFSNTDHAVALFDSRLRSILEHIQCMFHLYECMYFSMYGCMYGSMPSASRLRSILEHIQCMFHLHECMNFSMYGSMPRASMHVCFRCCNEHHWQRIMNGFEVQKGSYVS